MLMWCGEIIKRLNSIDIYLKMENRNKNWLEHKLHPMHIYCRMRDMGIAKKISLWLCIQYEKLYGKILK